MEFRTNIENIKKLGISRRKSGVEVDIFVANLQDHKDSNEIYIYKLYDPIE